MRDLGAGAASIAIHSMFGTQILLGIAFYRGLSSDQRQARQQCRPTLTATQPAPWPSTDLDVHGLGYRYVNVDFHRHPDCGRRRYGHRGTATRRPPRHRHATATAMATATAPSPRDGVRNGVRNGPTMARINPGTAARQRPRAVP